MPLKGFLEDYAEALEEEQKQVAAQKKNAMKNRRNVRKRR